MNSRRSIIILVLLAATLIIPATAQIDSICAEAGITTSLDSPFANVPYVYGQVKLTGFDTSKKPPKVTVTLQDGQQTPNRFFPERSGYYCFRRRSATGTVSVDVDGIEVARRTLTSFGSSQQREDFEINASGNQRSTPPSVVSTKYSRPPDPRTVEIYKRAGEAEATHNTESALKAYKEITDIDPDDYVAWSRIGSINFGQKNYPEADAAFRKTLELKTDYVPAWVNVGQMRTAQKQFAAAAEIFRHAASLEPASPMIYRLMGEAYLQAKQGTLGVEALDKAIELDPVGQAECHLLKAHLYELAGAKKLAVGEYKALLAKVPDHKDRKKFEKFIYENP